MGLHSSAGRALQHDATRPQVLVPLKPQKTFFRTTSRLLKLQFNCDDDDDDDDGDCLEC